MHYDPDLREQIGWNQSMSNLAFNRYAFTAIGQHLKIGNIDKFACTK